MTDLQAALGRSQLRRLDDFRARRAALADRYDELLADLPLHLPVRQPDRTSAWHLYAIELDTRLAHRRADVFRSLRQAGIGVNVHYIPIHCQPFYRSLGFKLGDFPAAEQYYAGAITLPLFPSMTSLQQDRVVTALRDALAPFLAEVHH